MHKRINVCWWYYCKEDDLTGHFEKFPFQNQGRRHKGLPIRTLESDRTTDNAEDC
jgi:hypothetical protein